MQRISLSLSLSCLCLVPALVAHANQRPEQPSVFVDRFVVTGLQRTRERAIVELLPRPLPARIARRELRELQRRLGNMNVFDSVSVQVEGSTLRVAVREKISLAPVLSVTTGKTLADIDITAGAVEYNLFGDATRLLGQFRYTQRGLNFDLWLMEHTYRPDRWAMEGKLYLQSSGFRFDDSRAQWQRYRLAGEYELVSPFRYGSNWRFELIFKTYYERMAEDALASAPNDGVFLGATFELIWDRFSFHDVAPKGLRFVWLVTPGHFFGRNEFRGEIGFKYLQALPLWRNAVLVLSGDASAVNGGNVNHSVLIGTQNGVRGLPDSLYRNIGAAFLNVELRQSVWLGERWALQVAGLADAALFDPMDERGRAMGWASALSVGGGLRIIPTFLAHTILRLDAGRLLHPTGAWFWQASITQYIGSRPK